MNKKNIINSLINQINLMLDNKLNNLTNEIIETSLITLMHLIHKMNILDNKKINLIWFKDYKDVITSSKKVVKELTKLL